MKNTITLAAMCVLAASGTAGAGGQKDSVGLGAEFGLNGETGGVSMNYDAGKFHFGGFLGLSDGAGDDNTDVTFGGRFYYHLHSTAMSDFGLGGGFGYLSIDQAAPDDRIQLMFLEPGFQIRLFIASNVALSFTAGITIGLVDADGVSFGGQRLSGDPDLGVSAINGAAGIHYYFF